MVVDRCHCLLYGCVVDRCHCLLWLHVVDKCHCLLYYYGCCRQVSLFAMVVVDRCHCLLYGCCCRQVSLCIAYNYTSYNTVCCCVLSRLRVTMA